MVALLWMFLSISKTDPKESLWQFCKLQQKEWKTLGNQHQEEGLYLNLVSLLGKRPGMQSQSYSTSMQRSYECHPAVTLQTLKLAFPSFGEVTLLFCQYILVRQKQKTVIEMNTALAN